LLVSVLLLPASEVADVTGAANVSGPGFVGLHHRFIKANRKENRLVILTPLLLESSLDLLPDRGIPDVAFVDDFSPRSPETYLDGSRRISRRSSITVTGQSGQSFSQHTM
jgi:hypothetical protein